MSIRWQDGFWSVPFALICGIEVETLLSQSYNRRCFVVDALAISAEKIGMTPDIAIRFSSMAAFMAAQCVSENYLISGTILVNSNSPGTINVDSYIYLKPIKCLKKKTGKRMTR